MVSFILVKAGRGWVKLITRDVDYAIRALCYMAQTKKERVSVSELVKELNVPRPFLRKILQILNKKGLLKSQKGKGGGFQLAALPDKIFLVDLIEIFQGPFKLNECVLKKEICYDIKGCILRKRIGDIEKNLVKELKVITLRSLLEA